MREKSWKLVITFPSTTAAMAMEQACREAGAPGRLIPVPQALSAGCGMAWMAPPEAQEALERLARSRQIPTERCHRLLL